MKTLTSADPVLQVRTDGFLLSGNVNVPPNPTGLIVLANGDREDILEKFRALADHLASLGLATFPLDLIAKSEHRMRVHGHSPRSNPALLRARLRLVLEKLRKEELLSGLPVILVASGVAAAAAISLCANTITSPKALVLVDGRTDLSRADLYSFTVPTLLVVDRTDEILMDMNVETFAKMNVASKALIEVGPDSKDWADAYEEISAWICQWL